MTLDQLQYFYTAAQLEHLGQAALRLHVSPATVSHAITALEDELGQTLFARKGRNVHLTPIGKEFMVRAASLLAESNAIKEEFQTDLTQLKGSYKLAASHFLAEYCLTPALLDTTQQFPNITCELFSFRSVDIISGLLQGDLDAGLCFSPQANQKLISKNLVSGRLIPAVKATHPILKLAKSKMLESLNQYPAVGAKSFSGIDVCEDNPILEAFGLNPGPGLLYDSYSVAMEALLKTESWSLMPDWIISRSEGKLQAVHCPKDWKAKFEICFVYRKQSAYGRVFETLQKNLQRHVAAY